MSRQKLAILRSVLFALLFLGPGLPVEAQQPAPPPVVFAPHTPPRLIFAPAQALPQVAAFAAQLRASQAQVAAAQAQALAAQAQTVVAQAQATTAQSQAAAAQATAAQAQAQAALTAPTVYGQPFTNRFSDASPSGPHLFFPHYQTSGGDYGKTANPEPGSGSSPSVAQATLDLAELALQSGDGFSLDLGGADIQYVHNRENLFAAEDAWNTQQAGIVNPVGISALHSFITFDFGSFGPEDPPTIEAVLLQSFAHPSYYKYQGKYFVSCYTGAGGRSYDSLIALWKTVLADMAAKGYPVYFVPGFENTDASGNGLQSDVPGFTAQASGLLTQIPAGGAWDYGAALGIPLSPSRTSLPRMDALSKVTKAFGLSYMGTVTPCYEGLEKGGRWYNEYYGGETLDHEWQSLLGYAQNPVYQTPSWVQFVSWNDYDEFSRLTNADEGPASPWPYLPKSGQADYYLSTLGLQALSRYYVQWYKTGVRPSFASDNLFAFYRTQPAALDVPGDAGNKIGYATLEDGEGPGPSLVPDTFFVATGLPSQATLTITNGGQTLVKQVPAGLFFSRVGPFVPGPVLITLSRNGAVTTTLAGHAIAASATFYDGSVWSGYAHN